MKTFHVISDMHFLISTNKFSFIDDWVKIPEFSTFRRKNTQVMEEDLVSSFDHQVIFLSTLSRSILEGVFFVSFLYMDF